MKTKARDLGFKRKQRQLELEMEMKLGAVQSETELVDLRDQTSLKMQEMKLQIELAERSCSNTSPSRMVLSVDEHNDSCIKKWLDHNSDSIDFQKQKLHIVENAGKAKQRSPAMQEFHKVEDILRVFFDGKDPSTECKGGKKN